MQAKNKKRLPKNKDKQDNDRFKDVPLNFENIIKTATNYDPKKSENEKIKPFMLLITEENYEQVVSIIGKENLKKLNKTMNFKWNFDLIKTLHYVNGKFIKFQTDLDMEKHLAPLLEEELRSIGSYRDFPMSATLYYNDIDYRIWSLSRED